MGGGAAAQPSPVTPMRRRIEIVTPARGGISPVATKARLHEIAVEPDSIERELSLSEVTYSLWQLKAQQMNDHQWFLQATAAMDNHAATLDRQAISIIKLRPDTAEAVTQTQSAVERVAEHHTEHKRAIEMLGKVAEDQHKNLDTSLRGHVVEEVTRMNARIDALTQAAGTSGTVAGFPLRMEQVNADLMRLEELINVRTVEISSSIQAEKGDARATFNSIRLELQKVGGRVDGIEARGNNPSSSGPREFGAEFDANFTASGHGGFPMGGGQGGPQQQQYQPTGYGRTDGGNGGQQHQQRQQPQPPQQPQSAAGAKFFNMDYDAAGVSQQARSLYDEKVAQTPN